MKKNKSRTPVLKKMFCVFFSVLSLFILLPTQPGVVAEAYNADYTVIMSVSGTSKALTKNKLYYSPNKTYACVFQSDGNLVVYRHRPWEWGDQVTRDNAIWKSGTNGIAQNGNCYLQKDGNLVVYAANGAPKFSTYHSYQNLKGVQLRLDNTGVLSVYYKPKGLFSDWTFSWNSSFSPTPEYAVVPANGIRKGVLLKKEPDASLLVGKWVTENITQNSDAYIIIEFEEKDKKGNYKFDVEMHDVLLKSAPWTCHMSFTASDFGEYTGFDPRYDMEVPLRYDPVFVDEEITEMIRQIIEIFTGEMVHTNDEGTRLWLRGCKYKRYVSTYLES